MATKTVNKKKSVVPAKKNLAIAKKVAEKSKKTETNIKQVKLGTQVHSTEDYHLFKHLDGNRNLVPLHVNKLMESMKKNYLFSPIIVNENYEVIDGQHRLECVKTLGFKIYYIICEGYGLREVQILNANNKNWNADSYVQGYCDLGYTHYIKYKEFKDKYGFGHRETQAMLEGGQVSRDLQDFYMGDFKVKDYDSATEIAENIIKVGTYFSGYKMRSFVLAMMQILKNKDFSMDEFVSKLKIQPMGLQKCATIEQYKDLVENLYNYRRREKVNLRF